MGRTRLRGQFNVARSSACSWVIVRAPTSYQCTTRAEACVVDSATVDDSAPFKFASETPSTSLARQADAKRRSRVGIVFSRALFYDSGGTLLEARVLRPQ